MSSSALGQRSERIATAYGARSSRSIPTITARSVRFSSQSIGSSPRARVLGTLRLGNERYAPTARRQGGAHMKTLIHGPRHAGYVRGPTPW